MIDDSPPELCALAEIARHVCRWTGGPDPLRLAAVWPLLPPALDPEDLLDLLAMISAA